MCYLFIIAKIKLMILSTLWWIAAATVTAAATVAAAGVT